MSAGLEQQIEVNQTELNRMRSEDNRRIANELRKNSRVVSLSKRRLNPYRRFTYAQHARVARSFEAETQFVSARKKRINVSLPEIKRLNKLVDQAWNLWRAMTVPYPEQGRRLVRNEDIPRLESVMNDIAEEIREAEAALDDVRQVVLDDAKHRLGRLFNEAEYPASFRNHWGVALEYPNVEPDAKLATLSPELYEREARRIAARFDQAVATAEEEFTEQFTGMIEKLAERMQPKEDGSAKIFNASTIENLNEFFDRFGRLNLHSSKALDEAVEMAKQVVGGVTPESLRKDAQARERVGDAMTQLGEKLETMLKDRPKRSITFDD